MRKFIFWLVILVAVASFYYFYEIRYRPDQEKLEEREHQVVKFERDGLREFTKNSVKFVKDGDNWRIVEPVPDAGDQDQIDTLLTYIFEINDRETIETHENLGQFGLDPPIVEFSLSFRDQQDPVVIKAGKQTLYKETCYVLAGEGGPIIIANDELRIEANKGLYEYRNKNLIDADKTQVTSIDLLSDETLFVINKEGDEWEMKSPIEARADRVKVETIISKLNDAKIKAFIKEDADNLDFFGLEPPMGSATLHLGDEKVTKGLYFGTENKEARGRHVMVHGSDDVLLVDEEVASACLVGQFDLRDKVVCDFDIDDVAGYILEYEGRKIEIERDKDDDDKWRIKSPVEADADSGDVTAVLYAARKLKAKEFPETPATDDETGLDAPSAQIEILMKGEAESKWVKLGGKKADSDNIYCLTDEIILPVLVSQSTKTRLNKKAFDLRDKKLVHFERDAVERIEIEYGEKTAVLTQRGEKRTWKVKTNPSVTVEDMVPSRISWQIGSLEIAETVNKDATEADYQSHGLQPPWMTVKVFEKDNPKPHVLKLGADQPHRKIYVSSEETPGLHLSLTSLHQTIIEDLFGEEYEEPAK